MKADLILHNARVFTVDRATPWAEAVACAQGRILAVGSNDDVTSLTGSATRVIDVGKRLVLPGLTDAHVHFLHYVAQRQQVCLFGVNSPEEVRQRVRRAVEQAPPGSWVQGWGWGWDAPPHRWLLDDIAPRTPVVLKRMDMHTWWVNAAALELAGISAETPDPARGRIERDFAGAPTGILCEWDAIRLVESHIPQPDEVTLLKWLLAGISEAHRSWPDRHSRSASRTRGPGEFSPVSGTAAPWPTQPAGSPEHRRRASCRSICSGVAVGIWRRPAVGGARKGLCRWHHGVANRADV
ncbi:MAG: amidohydrolase family protein, partial [Ardenticatenia bacterium]|nr:amidohydrolase family protein [Ardenticatenia bacterium]